MPEYIPTDPLFAQQWNLRNTGQSGGVAGIDINVTQVWPDYTGAGVTVAIYDNGVEYTHPDLNDNYDASQHIIINGVVSDAFWSPTENPDEGNPQFVSHGTFVAGLVGGENNGSGMVGVAFDATLVGVLAPGNGAVTPSAALVQAMQQASNFDITTNSWGHASFRDGIQNAAWTQYYDGVFNAVANGRDGLGTIIVRAIGNLGPAGFDSQGFDGNSKAELGLRQVIAVGGVTDAGVVTNFASRGANILVSGPTGTSGTGSGNSHSVWSTDITGANGLNTAANGDYFRVSGTSSATPQVAGVVALMLEANPNLGWRDVQNILASSARNVGSAVGSAPLAAETDAWEFNGADNWNGGGRHFSIDYGFGLVDALAAVRMAETWHVGGGAAATSANEVVRNASVNSGGLAIPDNNGNSVTLNFEITQDVRIENVRLSLGLPHTRINDLHIRLVSPEGTTSLIFNPIVDLAGNQGVTNGWVFGSQEFRGELGAGTWQAVITDLRSGNVGTLGTSQLFVSGSSNLTNDKYIYTNEFSSYADLAGRSTLNDSNGGNDTINAAAVTLASRIDLSGATTSTIDGHVVTIAAGVIENAVGGDGDDEFIGSNLDNILSGGRGSDTFNGGLGNDTLDGGAGSDTAIFAGNRAAYTITRNGLTTTVAGADGTDSLNSIERLQFADATVGLGGGGPDFNGDGRMDVLFSLQGAVYASNYEWQMNDRAISAQGAIDLYDKSFTLQIIGDFDGDGKSDVVFQNPTTGGIWAWLLDGVTIKSQGAVDVADPSYHLLGSADFNGDGRDDLLFRNDAGFIYQWQMNGIGNTPLPVGPLDPSWHVQGAGDFDGDGNADILLRNIGGDANTNGAFFLWKMDGNQIIGQGGIERPPTDWKTLGLGDFDGDGKTDFAVRNVSATGDNGAVWVYLMNGTTIKAQGAAGIADAATWHVQQIGDLNGDGKDDILFRNDAGYFYSWDMNGTTIASEGLAGTEAGNWADPALTVVTQHWDLV